jgi:hypothetical protein
MPIIQAKWAGLILAHSAAQVASTNTTSEEVLVTVAVPANAMGANGFLLADLVWNCTSNANVKTARVRFGASGAGTGGTVFNSPALTSTSGARFLARIANRNATNSQVGGSAPTNITGLATGAANAPTSAIDTTAASEIAVTSQKATGTDSMTLESYTVWLYYRN